MPIYEYKCNNCGRRLSVFWQSFSEVGTKSPRCSRCGSPDLRRVMSRVAVLRSEESQMEAMADPSAFGDLDENDPKSIGKWMRKMGREMGEDLGDDFGEAVERLEAGESPEDIEASMPELGGMDSGGGFDDF
jgi:putative FmdB family regulatory protein